MNAFALLATLAADEFAKLSPQAGVVFGAVVAVVAALAIAGFSVKLVREE